MLLGIDLSEEEKQSASEFGVKLDAIVQKIKLLSIEIQRSNANEWNQFIDAAINNNYWNLIKTFYYFKFVFSFSCL